MMTTNNLKTIFGLGSTELCKKYNCSLKERDGLLVFRVSDETVSSADAPFLKGLLIDKEDNVVCPGMNIPLDSDALEPADLSRELTNAQNKFYPVQDGVMMRLFYYNGQWNLATAGSSNADGKWNSDLTFRQMYDEIAPEQADMTDLNPDFCYYVLMQHTRHYSYTQMSENRLTLVRVVHKSSFSQVPLDKFKKNFQYVREPLAEQPTEDDLKKLFQMNDPAPIDSLNHGYMIEKPDGMMIRVPTANAREAERLFPNVPKLGHHWFYVMNREDYERLPYDTSIYLNRYVYKYHKLYLSYFPQFQERFKATERKFERLLYEIIDHYYHYLARGSLPYVNPSQLKFLNEMILHFNGQPKNHVQIAYYLVGQDIPRLIYLINNLKI